MNSLVFDGGAHPIGFVPISLVALVPLGIWLYLRCVRKRQTSYALALIALALFAGINGIEYWDLTRVHEMLRSGNGVQVTRGVISESWVIVSHRRDWSSSFSYKKTISEGFDVNGLRFKWNRGDSFSAATFSNAKDPPLTFPKGTPVEVTWFVDEAADNARRIVRLKLGGVSPAPASGQATDLDVFHREFVNAFVAGDRARLTALTHFPFRFGAHTLEASQAQDLWTSLLMPAMQQCVQFESPVPEGHAESSDEAMASAALSLRCHGSALVFRRMGSQGWRFAQLIEVR